MRKADSLWLSLIRSANRRTKDNQTLRRAGILTYSSLVRANVFLPPPRVLLNGPRKSGTHLLSDCLSLMPRMMFSGRHFALDDFSDHSGTHHDGSDPGLYSELQETRLRNFLKRTPQGMFTTAHARFHPFLADLIEELDFRQILLLRDPRDVVVSYAFYVKREPLHHHHAYFTETLRSDQERIMASIRGFDKAEASGSPPLDPVQEVFAGFAPFLDHPSTLVVRFEDLVGPQGGEDAEKQLANIERLGAFVARPLNREQAWQISRKMYGKGSLTFRKGQTKDWQNHFTEAHRRAFKEVAGDTLIGLGYERDTDW